MTEHAPDPVNRAAALALELRECGERFCGLCRELNGIAHELARLDAEYNAALTRAELPRDFQPPARELAAEVALHALAPLRPFITQYVTEESAKRSAEALTSFFGRRAERKAGELLAGLERGAPGPSPGVMSNVGHNSSPYAAALALKLRAERKAGELLAGLERDKGGEWTHKKHLSDVGQVPSPYAAALKADESARRSAEALCRFGRRLEYQHDHQEARHEH